MSVQLLQCAEAITIGDTRSPEPNAVKRGFFDVFGITGCLLNCQLQRTVEQHFQHNKDKNVAYSNRDRRTVRAAWREHLSQSSGLYQEWFTASNITASSAQGCASCNIFRQIIQNLFFEKEEGLIEGYEYSIPFLGDFEIKRRSLQDIKKPVEVIQLFQPPGSSIQFHRLYKSNFLHDRQTSIKRLARWMKECLGTHKDCLKYTSAQNNNTRPARLLDLTPIQRQGNSGIRLMETETGTTYEYACLSHRWDDLVEQQQTTLGNISSSLDFLDLKNFPKNFRDAVFISRKLNIPYLWIDSICIIQRGDSGKDLNRELGKMSSIYQNAHLTIAAISSSSSTKGCFIKDKWQDKCFSVSTSEKETYLIGARVLDKKGYTVSADVVDDRFPLLSRAWVFQECLLSPRLLQCNYGEFVFNCLESSQCECNSHLAPHPNRTLKAPGVGYLTFTNRVRLHMDSQLKEQWRSNDLKYWKIIVKEYMKLKLTQSSDVLPAIAGCAQVLAPKLGFKYIAGMWKESLWIDLLWYVTPQSRGAQPKPRPKNTTAPSWSWASVSMGQIIENIPWKRGDEDWLQYDALLDQTLTEIHCEPESVVNPFGKLKEAYLKFDAVLYPWYLRLFCWETTQERGLKWYKDLYIQRPKDRLIKCTTAQVPELALNGATVQVHFDARFRDEQMEVETFSHCTGNPTRPCALAQIYLLHALHKEAPSKISDIFLLLKLVSPVNGKFKCYRRIGLMEMENKKADVQTWERMIQGRLKPQREEFWLF